MKKAVSSEMLGIILLVVGLAVAVVLFILLSSKGKILLGNLSALNITW
jgi:hypothetical protein